MAINPLDVLKCNCARCDIELIGSKMRGLTLPWTCDGQPFVGGFINQRPYCQPCIEKMNAEFIVESQRSIEGALQRLLQSHQSRRRSTIHDDDDPAEQHAVRVMEDGGNDGEEA